MKRKSMLINNLILLAGFAGGYAVAVFTAKTVSDISHPATPSAIITQAQGPIEATSPVKDTQASPTAAPEAAAPDVATLQAQLAEKTAKINELQQKLANPSHETVTPEEDTPEYREKLAADLMELTKAKDMIQQSFKATAQMLGKDLTPEGQEALGQAMNKIYGWDKLEKSFSKVYTDTFSAQELNDMAEFYRTEAGANMLKKTPELMQKTTQVMQQINAESQQKLIAEMETISKKYRVKTATK